MAFSAKFGSSKIQTDHSCCSEPPVDSCLLVHVPHTKNRTFLFDVNRVIITIPNDLINLMLKVDKVADGDLLPLLPNPKDETKVALKAGDVRALENPALAAMHTIWLREHNRIASEMGSRLTDLSDEDVYQRARRIVIAEMQVRIYLYTVWGSDLF